MNHANMIGMIESTYTYFQALGNWHQDPAGLEAVQEIRDRMIQDLQSLDDSLDQSELKELCRQWRASRIEFDGDASYPPDMFIESVCKVVEIS